MAETFQGRRAGRAGGPLLSPPALSPRDAAGHREPGAGTAPLAPDLPADRPAPARGPEHDRPVATSCRLAPVGRSGASPAGEPLRIRRARPAVASGHQEAGPRPAARAR